MILRTWTVTAVDEFGRKFSYGQIEHPFANEAHGYGDWAYDYMFKKAVRDILREMGEAAEADWYAEEGTWDLDLNSER